MVNIESYASSRAAQWPLKNVIVRGNSMKKTGYIKKKGSSLKRKVLKEQA